MEPILEMDGVYKDFGQGVQVVHALRPTDFRAYPGKVITILGPSGAGKSTFLTILGGLQEPSGGKVNIGGMTFSGLPPKRKAALRLKTVGFVLQAYNLIPFLTTREQLELLDRVQRRRSDNKWLTGLLAELGIADLERKYPNELSGGQKQRVAIAKALYGKPRVLFADEPTASLDTANGFAVMELLTKITKAQDMTTVVVTHDERLTRFCDESYEIVDGVLTKTKG